MRIISSLYRNILGLLIFVSSTQCWSMPTDLVKLSGQIVFGCVTGNGGFENQCADPQQGPFTLVYDPLIPDTDPSGTNALYRNTILSFNMTISQLYRPDLVFSLVDRGNISVAMFGSGPPLIRWSMVLKEKNDVVDPSVFTFNLMFYLEPNAAVAMPSIDEWINRTEAYVAGGAGANETDWLYGPLTAQTISRPLPLPASPWLLLIGAAMIVLHNIRTQKSRC